MERTIIKLLKTFFLALYKYLCVKLQAQKYTIEVLAPVHQLENNHKLLHVNVWLNKSSKNSYNSVYELWTPQGLRDTLNLKLSKQIEKLKPSALSSPYPTLHTDVKNHALLTINVKKSTIDYLIRFRSQLKTHCSQLKFFMLPSVGAKLTDNVKCWFLESQHDRNFHWSQWYIEKEQTLKA